MKPDLTGEQIESLYKIIDTGVNHAAEILNTLSKSRVNISVIELFETTFDGLLTELSNLRSTKLLGMRLSYRGDLKGVSLIALAKTDATYLINSIMDGDENQTDEELDTLRIITISEIENIVLNEVIGSIRQTMSFRLNYSLPTYLEDRPQNIAHMDPTTPIILFARTQFNINQRDIDSALWLAVDSVSFYRLINRINLLSQS